VRDSGTGIPPEILPKLFDPFFTTKPEGKGTGLGLATVMRVMRRHRGFVTIDTELGKGTCFTCHFPVATAGVAPTAPLAAVT
jgi:two-component system cell cycle sensor histidine kinase/response regulator CckA